ncbi:hypothetical protein AAKU52_002036 [Pedobacter sp. CG_S7]|uniref:hypothetical protein n=1 Tax=Pedobacter sp. CG_S7 TaxID=3143930 RepID=UPI003394D9C9
MKRFVKLYILVFILSGLTFFSCQRAKTIAPAQNTAIPQKKASCCTGKTPARFALKTNVPVVHLDTLSKVKYKKP